MRDFPFFSGCRLRRSGMDAADGGGRPAHSTRPSSPSRRLSGTHAATLMGSACNVIAASQEMVLYSRHVTHTHTHTHTHTPTHDCVVISRIWRIHGRTLTMRVMPGFHHSVAVRCKIPLFCNNYVRKFRSVTAVNGKKIRNGSDNGNSNGVRKRQRLTGTEKRERKNGNGMVETRHNPATVRLPSILI